MTTAQLVIRAAQPDEIADLGFAQLLEKPGFRNGMFRVGILDDRIIAHAMIEHYTVEYGDVRLKVAGVGNVYTSPAFREKGHAARMMQDALTYMMEHDAHLALLNDTADGYFNRFGFQPVWPIHRMSFSSEIASTFPQPLQLRTATHDDLPQLMALFEQQWSGRVSLLRSPEVWAWRMQDNRQQVQVVINQDGVIEGYLAGRNLNDERVEVLAATPAAGLTLITAAGRYRGQTGNPMIHWIVPPDDPLVLFGRRWLDVTMSAQYRAKGGWSARIINVSSLLKAVRPELESQMERVGMSPDDLLLDFRSDSIKLALRNRKAAYLTPQDFVQIMFGMLTPTAFAWREGLPPEAGALLAVLFPPRVAAVAPLDWY